MSRSRKIEYHLRQLKELQSILTSMRTLSQLELRKLGSREEQYRETARILQEMVDEYLHYFPYTPPVDGHELVLVIGSERGFCGPFNELLVEHLLARQPQVLDEPWRVIGVGRKLSSHLDERLPGSTSLAGVGTSEEIAKVLPLVVSEVQRMLVERKGNGIRLLHHGDEQGQIETRRILPPERVGEEVQAGFPPHLYLDPSRFFRDFLDHYLYLSLVRLLSVSLLAENRYRVQHLGGAVHRLDERLLTLRTRARSLRQEEITEEIEMILLGSGAFDEVIPPEKP